MAAPPPTLILTVFLLVGAMARGLNARSRVSPIQGRSFLWLLAVGGWAVAIVVSFASIPEGASPIELARGWLRTGLIAATGIGLLFFAWHPLAWLTRLGRPKLVHGLARGVLLFGYTDETHAGACLLAGLALAHRGNATREERAWLLAALERETRLLGTHATAYAVYLALEARAARDEGRGEQADLLAEQARLVLGTVTYFSPAAVRDVVRRCVYELLTLIEASRGMWGQVMGSPKELLPKAARLVRTWADERLKPPAEGALAKTRKKRTERTGSPHLDALFARKPEESEELTAADGYARACAIHRALVAGRAVGPRRVIFMLAVFDMLLHPEFPETALPEEVRKDEPLLESVYDEIAESIATTLVLQPVPFFALDRPGVISARVYQRLEAKLLNELSSALDALNERYRQGVRASLHEELLETARVRGIYRRIEQCFGAEAVARYLPILVECYGNFAVGLSETWPRRRPLAYSVFNVLHGEARRFQHPGYVALQQKNMNVTSKAD